MKMMKEFAPNRTFDTKANILFKITAPRVKQKVYNA